MSDQTFTILRICLLALVYLTFFRVLRAVWVEIRAESPRDLAVARVAPSPADLVSVGSGPAAVQASRPSAGSSRLVVIAPPSLAGTVWELASETTIGRANGCGVVIDDPRVSKVHARLSFSAGGWVIEDLGSTNGTMCDGQRLVGSQSIAIGGRIQIGDVVMELA